MKFIRKIVGYKNIILKFVILIIGEVMVSELYNLKYLDEISNGDNEFRNELLDIFISQIPAFVSNLKCFFKEGNFEKLALEAHTAKSSVLVFGMLKTSETLKTIQLDSEKNEVDGLADLIKNAEKDMTLVLNDLIEIRKTT